MDRIFACRINSYGQYAQEAWDHLPRLGIENVECHVPPGAGDKADLRRLLDDSGLRVTSFQCDCDIHRMDPGEYMRPQLETCAEFDASVAFVSVRAGELGPDEAARRLRYVGDVAAGLGIAVALEIHPDLATNGSVALKTMQRVHHPNVRINFDTANIYFYNRGLKARDELAKVLDFVASVHLKDTKGGYKSFRFPPLGEGIVDFAEVFAMLDRREFPGPYTLELEGVEGKSYTRQQRLDMVERSVDFLKALGVLPNCDL
jgi:sugar phosphate isomerase/epimerase